MTAKFHKIHQTGEAPQEIPQITMEIQQGRLSKILSQPEVGGLTYISSELLDIASPDRLLLLGDNAVAIIAEGGPFIYHVTAYDPYREAYQIRRLS